MLTQLSESINCDTIYEEVKSTFDAIIQNNDYDKLLDYYNRKSIASRIGSLFGLKDNELPLLITRLSKNKIYTNEFNIAINKYLPKKLISLVNKNDDKE